MKYDVKPDFFLVALPALLLLLLVPLISEAQQNTPGMTSHEVRQDGNRFDVLAEVSNGGNVTGIQVFPEYGSILITIESGSEEEASELRIILPRDLIDSRDDQTDSEFFIVVEGEDTEYTELRATENEREIEVPLSEGASQVEIFGNHIVPEFSGALLSVVVSSFAVVIVSITILRKNIFQTR